MDPAPPTVKPQERPRLRLDLIAFWVLLVIPPAILAGVIWNQSRTSVLEDELVRNANAWAARTWTRPLHREPAVPGDFAELVERELPAFEQSAAALKGQSEEDVDQVIRGEKPLAALPQAYQDASEQLGPALDRLRAAARSEKLTPIPWMGPFKSSEGKIKGLALANRLLALDVRLLVLTGNADEAVGACLDALAFGRDLRIGTGLTGAVQGATLQSQVARPCGEALIHASAQVQKDAVHSLEVIRDAAPSFSQTVRAEGLATELRMAGRLLPQQKLARLDPAPRAAAQHGNPPGGWFKKIFTRGLWPYVASGIDAQAAAVALLPEEREKAMKRLDERLARRMSPIESTPLLSTWGAYADRHRNAQVRLTALAATAAVFAHHEQAKSWPRSMGELANGRELVIPEGIEMDVLPELKTDATKTQAPRRVELFWQVREPDEKTEQLLLVSP